MDGPRAICAALILALLTGCAFETRTTAPLTIPCVWEEEIARMGGIMDEYWREAQGFAGVQAKRERPRVCFSPVPIVVWMENGSLDRLLGLYNSKRNDVLIAVLPEDSADLRYCTVLHEFMHALLGSGHKKVDAALPKECKRSHN